MERTMMENRKSRKNNNSDGKQEHRKTIPAGEGSEAKTFEYIENLVGWKKA
jgi:hypothetical protein